MPKSSKNNYSWETVAFGSYKKKSPEEWDENYENIIRTSIETYEPRKAARLIKQFLSKKSATTWSYVNVRSRQIFRFLLKRGLSESLGSTRGKVAVGFLTLIDQDWRCSDRNIIIKFADIKRKVRNALSGGNFLAMIEIAFYKNEKHEDGGNLLSVHVHAVVWGSSYSQLQKQRGSISDRFKPVFRGSKAVHMRRVKTLKDAERSVDYKSKISCTGYKRYRRSNGRMAQGTARLSYADHYALFLATKDRSIFDFAFSGGEGTKILRLARQVAKGKIPSLPTRQIVRSFKRDTPGRGDDSSA
jgi:hypothetical protein